MKMKKVMMFVAMAVCAVSVQAASVSWGNSGSPIVNNVGATMSSTDAAACNLIVQLINVTQGGTVIGNATINSMTPGSLQGANSNYVFGVDGTTGDLYKVMMYATFGGEDYYMEITNPAWTVKATDNGGIDTFGWAAGASASGNWVLIPEPTAMALLALGAVAFGLRRRFRK